MSVATKTALVTYLQADSTLMGMLAVDSHPNSGGRKALYGSWRGNNPKDLPQLVIMQADARPDPAEELSGHIFHETWHFEAWAQTLSDIHSSIIERVQYLLHEKRFALGTGLNPKYIQLLSSISDGYDGSLRENFAIQIYELCYSM